MSAKPKTTTAPDPDAELLEAIIKYNLDAAALDLQLKGILESFAARTGYKMLRFGRGPSYDGREAVGEWMNRNHAHAISVESLGNPPEV